MLQKHFRKIALEISGKTEETERMYFLCPKQCLASGFDTHAQQFRMRMQDADGCCAEFRVRYRKESKDFIEELEHIGRHMTEHPEQVCYYDYVWLCTAAFEDGELVFFPIEVYDFIETYAAPDWTAPPDMPDSVHVPQIAALFAEVSDWLCELVQSGVRSAPDGRGKELSHKADRCGMTGLSGMITALAEQAEQYRHSLHTDASGALAALVQLQHYLESGREKLAVLSALQQMQPES